MILKELLSSLFRPNYFYEVEFENKSVKEGLAYILLLYIVGLISSFFFWFFELSVLGVLLVLLRLALVIGLTWTITQFFVINLMRFKSKGVLIIKDTKYLILKVLSYGMSPVILFMPMSIFSIDVDFANFLSNILWYWIVPCTIGISKICRISKFEAAISLFLSYIIATKIVGYVVQWR